VDQGAGGPGEGGNPFNRGPRAWAPDAPAALPQLVVAAEHYNRLVRMVQRELTLKFLSISKLAFMIPK